MLLMIRYVTRKLPDGEVRTVYPFHMSLEGKDTAVLCRDDDDYDAMVKIMCVAAWKENVIIVIHAVVSNHCHSAVLATDRGRAEKFGKEVKRIYSMWLRHKYGERNFLDRTGSQAIPMETNSHIRNALAYIPRNAIDNKCQVSTYPWSGYGAMFNNRIPAGAVPVSSLTRRESMDIMHTGRKLADVPWLLDYEDRLIPRSFCDWEYLEQAFEHDQAFWLRTVGGLNSAKMQEDLIDAPREMKSDSELYKSISEICMKWFQTPLKDTSMLQRCTILPYIYRTMRTTVSQLARVLTIAPEKVKQLLCR